jgi:hypothetical protein
MQQCPQCNAQNPNKNSFCGSCGEIVRVDPGFAKKIRLIQAEDRKNGRAKRFTAFMVTVTVLSLLGYEMLDRLTTSAVKKVTPMIQAQVEANVQNSLKANLPAIASQATQQVAVHVRQELTNGYEQAAREAAQKVPPGYQARLTAIQAEGEAKVRAAYEQAAANIKQGAPAGAGQFASTYPLSVAPPLGIGTDATFTVPGAITGFTPALALWEYSSRSPSDDILKSVGGSPAGLAILQSLPSFSAHNGLITDVSHSSSVTGLVFPVGGACFTDKGTVGAYGANAVCQPWPPNFANVQQ